MERGYVGAVRSLAAIHVTTVTDLHDDNTDPLLFDLIDNPVDALPDPIPLSARELFAAGRTRIVSEGVNPLKYADYVASRDVAKILRDRTLE